MHLKRSLIRLLILLSISFSPGSFAQDLDYTPTPPAAPTLDSLQTNWWAFFEGSAEEVQPKIDTFLEDTKAQIAELEPQNREFAASILSAVRDNLSALLTLTDDTEPEARELSAPAESYSIDELLKLAAVARAAHSAAEEVQLMVDREKRVYSSSSRHRDALFDDYVSASSKEGRWLAGLRLLEARASQAISEHRLALLTQRLTRANAYAQAIADRAERAIDHLATTTDTANLDKINKQIEIDAAEVTAAEEALRAIQVAASSLDLDTPEGRSQQRLQQELLVEAEIGLTMAQITLATSEAERWWVKLFLNMVPETSELEDQTLAWLGFIRTIEQRAPEWKKLTEDELLSVQGVNRQNLNQSTSRLLDKRLSTAKALLIQERNLYAAVADLKLLMRAVDTTAAKSTGPFKAWLTSVSRNLKTAYIRVSDASRTTLFSISETPVTGADILRVLIILSVAYLISLGIRHTIQRVGERESSGAQASLYTLGRLSHYATIILGVFIALSSIGLDFSNLALVAGALSVGIGFGLQSIVNNFVSGLIILFEHTLRVGDYIELDTGLTGTVKSINVRSTLINTNDNIDIVVPNSEFVTTRLTNLTLGEGILRIRIPFRVAYGTDKELVKKAAIEAAAEVSFTLTNMKSRAPDVWLTEFADNGLDFLLLVWVNRMGARRPTRARAAYLWELETKFKQYGIERPFPQRDLHLRSGWPTTEQTHPAATSTTPEQDLPTT